MTCSYQGVCAINNGGCHPSAQCRENTSTYTENVVIISDFDHEMS